MDLKNKLMYLIKNKDKLEYYKHNARQFIVENFSVKKMVKDTEKLYESLLEKK